MKVSKTGSAKGPDATKKAKKSSAEDGAFADTLRGVSGADAAEQAQATGGVGAVNSILAVQQTADATDHRSRGLMLEYGNDLLDRLEQIRVAVLTGTISKDRLQELARKLRERKSASDDPKLNDLIAEVELRVEVEIAKFTR
ncbi:MAG: flagellar assembly protein FliX [Rhodospirillales bacterium]|nr:flagellar assembly protein FliX [Rhodospirillales bacterium]MBO6787385.1 flagellar assembly protein FliX [Rhodospirillales bacterium]